MVSQRSFVSAIAECFARLSHYLGVRLSVRPSVTLRYCVWELLYTVAAPRTLVCRDKISCPCVQRFLSNEGIKEGYTLKKPLLARIVWKRLQISTDILLIITSTGDNKLFRFINIDNLKWPWTLQKRVLVKFSQFFDATHISTLNCDEMAGDRPKQPAYEIFSIKRRY